VCCVDKDKLEEVIERNERKERKEITEYKRIRIREIK
jgi:hypothetical protein